MWNVKKGGDRVKATEKNGERLLEGQKTEGKWFVFVFEKML